VSGPSSPVAWTLATVKLARSGDAARGKKLHEDCSSCHGEAGNVDIPDVPDLGGQDPLYIFKQLSDYKANTRVSSIMNEAVKALSERDMADLAAFYAAQKSPRLPGGARAATPRRRGSLRWRRPAPHSRVRRLPRRPRRREPGLLRDAGAASPETPGPRRGATLPLRRERQRRYRAMRDVSKRLTDAEIAALASTTPALRPTNRWWPPGQNASK
jgi:cytochrome c553